MQNLELFIFFKQSRYKPISYSSTGSIRSFLCFIALYLSKSEAWRFMCSKAQRLQPLDLQKIKLWQFFK